METTKVKAEVLSTSAYSCSSPYRCDFTVPPLRFLSRALRPLMRLSSRIIFFRQ